MPVRTTAKENALKTTAMTRQVLSEVTTTAVNRKASCGELSLLLCSYVVLQDTGVKLVVGKDRKEETGSKRGRSDSTTLAQRIPLGPGRGQVAPPVANTIHAARVPISRARMPVATAPKRASRIIAEQIREEIKEVDPPSEMEIENEHVARDYDEEDRAVIERGTMIDIDDSETEDEVAGPPSANPRLHRYWPEIDTVRAEKFRKEVEAIREAFTEEVDMYDTSMVSEYSEEIFEYMSQLEVNFAPLFSSWILTFVQDECNAWCQLYGYPARNFLEHAPDSGRLATAGSPSVSYAPRDPLDRRQYRRSIFDKTHRITTQAAACRRDRHVHCGKV